MKKILIAAFLLVSLQGIAQDKNTANTKGDKQIKEQQDAQAKQQTLQKAIDAGMKTPVIKLQANELTADEKAHMAESEKKNAELKNNK